jgi:hypothetical protein
MTTNRKLVWNTGNYYTAEGQVIFVELGWYPDRPELLAMYDRCRGICYVYDFSGVLDLDLSDRELQRLVMKAYDENQPEAKVDYSDSEYYPALTKWRSDVEFIEKAQWPDIKNRAIMVWNSDWGRWNES